jgi:hypothetical protein
MLTLWGKPRRFCDNLHRRDFLQVGSLGLGLTLADVLRLRAQGPAAKARRKSVILVWLDGGQSHMDTYDMKPNAPVEYRGEFKPIRTRVPGFDICELLPLQAQFTDKMTVLRGIKSWEAHSPLEVYTGFAGAGVPRHPAFGSIVSRLAGGEPGFPCYVTLNYAAGADSEPEQPYYVGAAHKPFRFTDYRGLANLSLPYNVSRQCFEERRGLLPAFDSVRRNLDQNSDLANTDTLTRQALDIITSGKVRDAFDLSREPDKVRDRYPRGKTWGGEWNAENLLRALRLVEAGAGVVTLSMGNWDTHGVPPAERCYPSLRTMLPLFDQSIHALVTDLHARGLDKDVVVVLAGEFGRSPQHNKFGGREHWPDAGAAVVIGGGLRMGQVIGQTNARGERAPGKPLRFQNLFATLYHLLGIDPETTIPDFTGRPQYLLDERDPIQELC